MQAHDDDVMADGILVAYIMHAATAYGYSISRGRSLTATDDSTPTQAMRGERPR
jgi:hypothetical protein